MGDILLGAQKAQCKRKGRKLSCVTPEGRNQGPYCFCHFFDCNGMPFGSPPDVLVDLPTFISAWAFTIVQPANFLPAERLSNLVEPRSPQGVPRGPVAFAQMSRGRRRQRFLRSPVRWRQHAEIASSDFRTLTDGSLLHVAKPQRVTSRCERVCLRRGVPVGPVMSDRRRSSHGTLQVTHRSASSDLRRAVRSLPHLQSRAQQGDDRLRRAKARAGCCPTRSSAAIAVETCTGVSDMPLCSALRCRRARLLGRIFGPGVVDELLEFLQHRMRRDLYSQ